MGVESSNRFEFLPLDRGVAFAWRNRGVWFRVALFFAVLEAAISLIFSGLSSGPIAIFAMVPAVIVHCWFIASIVNLAILLLRGQLRSVFSGIKGAFGVVPKVFLSLTVIFIVFGLGMPLSPISLPMWFIAALFSWAPIFVAADATVSDDKKKRRLEEDSAVSFFNYEEDDESEKRVLPRFNSFFVGRPTFDLGLSRSARFSMSQMSLTLYLVWFVMLAVTLPLAFVSFFFGLEGGSLGIVVHSFLEPFLLALVLGSMTASLIFGLPEESRDELAIAEAVNEQRQPAVEGSGYIRLQGRLAVNVAILVLSMLSVAGITSYMIGATAIPESTEITLLKAEQVGADVNLTVSVRDNSEQYRWMVDPRSFVLALPVQRVSRMSSDVGDSRETAESNVPSADQEINSTWLSYFSGNSPRSSLEPLGEVLTASGVSIYDENNNSVSLTDLEGISTGMRLVLTFGNANLANLRERELFYQRIPGFGSHISNLRKFSN